MKKILLVIFSLVFGFSLTSCRQNTPTGADTSSLDTEVAKKWLKLGQTELVSDAYTNLVYAPETKTGAAYYTLYAPTDINASIRVVSNKLEESYFAENTVTKVRYLSTSNINDDVKNTAAKKAVEFENTIKAAVNDYTVSVQKTYEATLSDLGYKAYDAQNNYLCVFYMPMLLRAYKASESNDKDGEITLTSFIIVPVYSTASGYNAESKSYSNSLVNTYVANGKLISFNYSDNTIK